MNELTNVNLNPAISHIPLTTPRDYTRAIVREIAKAYGVPPRAIWGGNRDRQSVKAKRAAIVAIMREKPHLSFPDLGRMFGLDHSTVMHHAKAAGVPSKKKPGLSPEAAARKERHERRCAEIVAEVSAQYATSEAAQ